MSDQMEEFVGSLTPEQQEKFISLLKEQQDNRKKIIPMTVDDSNVIPLTVDKGIVHPTPSEDPVVGEDFIVRRQDDGKKRKTVRGTGQMDCIDDGGSRNEQTQMPEAAKKIPPTPRDKRPPTQKKEYICSACNKPFMENPDIIYGDYPRCNNCGRK